MQSWLTPTILSAFLALSMGAQLKTEYEWKYFQYKLDNYSPEQLNRMYDYRTLIPTDFLRVSANKTLVATPPIHHANRIASLSRISSESGDSGPLLEPYPSKEWHSTFGFFHCPKITSVTKIFMDDCNRIWVVDSGKVKNSQVCPPQILAFDADTDELVEKVRIPWKLAHSSKNRRRGRLEVQFVETKDSCSKTWVYIGDPEGYGMVIWDGEDIWRLENDEIYGPDNTATTFNVDGQEFDQELGASIFVIVPPGLLREDYMLLRPLSSLFDYAVKVDDLHNSKDGKPVTYYKGNITLPSQELTRSIAKSGTLIGAVASDAAVACLHLENPLALEHIAMPILDKVSLQYTVSSQIVQGKGGQAENEEYWLLSNRYQRFATDTVNFDEINFRIMSVNVAELVKGTACESVSPPEVSAIEDKFFFRMNN